MKKKCKYCGKEFEDIANAGRMYCNYSCRGRQAYLRTMLKQYEKNEKNKKNQKKN